MFNTHIVNISDKVVFDGEAESVMMPGVEGEFEIVDLHGPIAALLAAGVVTVRAEKNVMKQNLGENDELLQDSKGRLYKTVFIEQGVMRFDGKELYAIVE